MALQREPVFHNTDRQDGEHRDKTLGAPLESTGTRPWEYLWELKRKQEFSLDNTESLHGCRSRLCVRSHGDSPEMIETSQKAGSDRPKQSRNVLCGVSTRKGVLLFWIPLGIGQTLVSCISLQRDTEALKGRCCSSSLTGFPASLEQNSGTKKAKFALFPLSLSFHPPTFPTPVVFSYSPESLSAIKISGTHWFFLSPLCRKHGQSITGWNSRGHKTHHHLPSVAGFWAYWFE